MSTTYEVDDDFARLEVQVKSWSAPVGDGESWRYRGLTEKRFNALAGRRRVPRYLFIVHVPDDVDSYACADKDVLTLKHAAYWVSLRDRERIPGPHCGRKIPVMVPQQNLLTVEELTKLCG
jgi:hypothetical protein